MPLARRGLRVVAVELGANLAEVAARRLVAYPSARVVPSSFEAWKPGDRRFDGVVAFNAIHRVDPAVRDATRRR